MNWFRRNSKLGEPKFNNANFEYKANGHLIRMTDGYLYVNDAQIDKQKCPVMYDLAVCLSAFINTWRR